VLLDRLLTDLATVPSAEQLLLGASVYRAPVDLVRLLFQVGTPDPAAAHTPDRAAAEGARTDSVACAPISRI
jgi:hypothetical protein